MKKLLFLTVLTMLFAVNAAAQIYQGYCGNNITWKLDAGKSELILTGYGKMNDYDYSGDNKPGWKAGDVNVTITFNGMNIPIPAFQLVTTIIIDPSITRIGNYSFKGFTALEKIETLNNIKEIGEGAFEGCSQLTISNIPEGITIEDGAFTDCTKMADAESGIIYAGKNLIQLYKSNINSVTVKAGITTIHKGAFKGKTNLTSITFADNSLTTIGDEAFSGCIKLNSINVPHTITSWGKNIFEGCDCLPVVGDYIMPCDHVIVGVNNTSKSEYTIGEDVIYIADDAFKDCNNMQKIYCYAETAPTSATAQLGNNQSYILYVNDGCEDDFKTKWNIPLDRINTTEVAIGSSGYTTLTLIHSAKVPTGTKAYTATINNGSIELTQVSKLAKGVGYIIWSTNGTSGTYKFNAAGEAVGEPEPSENMMKGVLKNTTLYGNGSIYLLSLYKGVVGFRCLGNNTYNLPAGKAYLESTDPSGSVERDFLNFGGDETDIEDTKEDEIINSRNNTTYNLAGQKLNAPQKGLNIVDGKLVLL